MKLADAGNVRVKRRASNCACWTGHGLDVIARSKHSFAPALSRICVIAVLLGFVDTMRRGVMFLVFRVGCALIQSRRISKRRFVNVALSSLNTAVQRIVQRCKNVIEGGAHCYAAATSFTRHYAVAPAERGFHAGSIEPCDDHNRATEHLTGAYCWPMSTYPFSRVFDIHVCAERLSRSQVPMRVPSGFRWP